MKNLDYKNVYKSENIKKEKHKKKNNVLLKIVYLHSDAKSRRNFLAEKSRKTKKIISTLARKFNLRDAFILKTSKGSPNVNLNDEEKSFFSLSFTARIFST